MFYLNYFWKKGIPIGRGKTKDPFKASLSYKIVRDPYRKHITIERYRRGKYNDIIYDSLLLDFRNLDIRQQMGWEKETLFSSAEKMVVLIRDQNDRVIFLEHHHFFENLCTKCQIFSPHGLLVSLHKMHYKSQGDNFNGVILYDKEKQPVMKKIYDINAENEFTTLLDETWDFSEKKAIDI